MTTPNNISHRLLLVAYAFPPVGGAGVQRPVKWVKNLRRFGWQVTVLTTENPSVPTRDESLLVDIPDDILIIRARTWEPNYRTKLGFLDQAGATRQGFFTRVKSKLKGLVRNAVKLVLQPDPQVLWVPNAIRAGRKILGDVPHDAILVTAPAYSSFFVGTTLKHLYGLPLILDFRDEWDISGQYLENAQRDWFSHAVQEQMQRYVLRRADAVIATTKASAANLAEKLVRLSAPAVPTITVYNGYDVEDFQPEAEPAVEQTDCQYQSISLDHWQKFASKAAVPESISAENASCHASESNGFRLLYTGTLWNLTTIKPLVEAILQLQLTFPELVSKLELVCVGRKTAEQTNILEQLLGTGCRLELIDYCQHAKVLGWLRSTNAVCLLLSDVPGAERVVPAKLFEYLANRRDMLAIMPRGEAADIVQRFFPLGYFQPKDIDGIARWLKSRLFGLGESDLHTALTANIDEFSRTTQTRKLAELLDQLIRGQSEARRSAH